MTTVLTPSHPIILNESLIFDGNCTSSLPQGSHLSTCRTAPTFESRTYRHGGLVAEPQALGSRQYRLPARSADGHGTRNYRPETQREQYKLPSHGQTLPATLSSSHWGPSRCSASYHVPSPIGKPLARTDQTYPFDPVIEDDDRRAYIQGESSRHFRRSSSTYLAAPHPAVNSLNTIQKARTPRESHRRLSIILTPPLLASSPHDESSPPLTPIFAALEEGYDQCLRAVLRHDAMVADVNRVKHLRISWDRLHYPANQAYSRGAYGDVWCGTLDGRRRVAIKRVTLKPQDGSSKLQLLKVLLKEVVPWHGLNHPNISSFIGYTFDDGSACMVSEWQDNGHVLDYVKRRPSANRLELIAQAAEGLAYLHAQAPALVHGDIKPENVLVSANGTIKLADFGLSIVLEKQSWADLRTTGTFRGTLRYADPTLLDGKPKTAHTDIWALGGLIYAILTLHHPFEGIQSEARIIRTIMKYDVPTPFTSPRLPHGAIAWPILRGCWSKSPAERWSASRIAQYLRCIDI